MATQATKRAPIEEPLIDINELSRWLAITPNAAYKKVARGEIPCVRVGRLLRFRRSEIAAIFRPQEVRASAS